MVHTTSPWQPGSCHDEKLNTGKNKTEKNPAHIKTKNKSQSERTKDGNQRKAWIHRNESLRVEINFFTRCLKFPYLSQNSLAFLQVTTHSKIRIDKLTSTLQVEHSI